MLKQFPRFKKNHDCLTYYKKYWKIACVLTTSVFCFFVISAGTEAKLLDSLVNRTIPMWWDDIDNLAVLEKLTVLLYNKACTLFYQYS